ncbi:exonuclease subunit gamma [Salmonella enterica subsp. enterica serovar Typhimurium]
MLRVYHSNRLDVLEALMEFIVERERLDDPFEPEMILVQSTGMAQWLQMTLSQKFGIAANIAFPLPASFIWEMFVRVLPDIPKESAFSKQSMSWKLMTLLPQLLDKDEFVLLRHYLTDDTDKRKLFQLSRAPPTCSISIWFIGLTGLRSGKREKPWKVWERRKTGRRRCGKHWWNIPPRWGSRAGIAPISTNALFKRWKARPPARQGCRPAFLFAAFPRYRQCISEHCRRWVNILKSISFLLIRVGITGGI